MAVRRMADTIENEGGASIGEKDCYQQVYSFYGG
jgi:hypothetical protein